MSCLMSDALPAPTRQVNEFEGQKSEDSGVTQLGRGPRPDKLVPHVPRDQGGCGGIDLGWRRL